MFYAFDLQSLLLVLKLRQNYSFDNLWETGAKYKNLMNCLKINFPFFIV